MCDLRRPVAVLVLGALVAVACTPATPAASPTTPPAPPVVTAQSKPVSNAQAPVAAAASVAPAIAAPTAPKQLLTVRYGFISTSSAASAIVDYLKKHELDKKYGIDLQVTRINNGTQLYDAFKGKALDGIQGGTESAASLSSTGVPLVAMRAFTKLSGFKFLVKTDSPYQTLADLRGKKVGGETLSGTSYFSTYFAFKTQGLDLQKDVTFVNLPRQALVTALERGDLEGAEFSIPLTLSMPKTGKYRAIADFSEAYQQKYNRPFFHLTHEFRKEFYDAHKDVLWNLFKAFDEASVAPIDGWLDASMKTFDGTDYGLAIEDMRAAFEASRPYVMTTKTTAETIQQVQAFYDDLFAINAIDKQAKATDFWVVEP